MIKFTPEQNQKLTLWAFARLRDVLATDEYDGDMWFTMDDTIPELKGKIDLNLYDDNNGVVRGAFYEVVTREDGYLHSNLDLCANVGIMHHFPELQ